MTKQHVIDPESCIGCSACEMACPQKAVMSIAGHFCIDYDLCQDCKKCINDCPTGACDTFIDTVEIYSVELQSSWQKIPQ